MNYRLPHRVPLLLACCLGGLPPVAQAPTDPVPVPPAEFKPPRAADPVKGYGEVTSLTGIERRRGRRPHADDPVAQRLLGARAPAAAAGRAAGPDFARVAYAVADDGRTWASGATYKASFGREGFTYVPFLGSDAPKNYPVQFAIAAVRVGGHAVELARDVAPTRTGDRVVFDRGGVREVYDLQGDAVEQTFVVDADLAGDIVVELGVRSELELDQTGAGLTFGNGRGGVDYGTAYVVDGASKRPLAASCVDGRLVLTVPAAVRPVGSVVIDPVISTRFLGAMSQDLDQPDIAFEPASGHYLVVWQRAFSASDYDVWCEMHEADGTPVAGSLQAIDNSSAYVAKPRVAALPPYNQFLAVTERYFSGNAAGAQYAIWGRTVAASAPFAMSNLTELSGHEAGDKRDPDVGGDGLQVYITPNLPRYLLAYTREVSSTDHDILARLIGAHGSAASQTILVENSAGTIYRDVEVSRSNGRRVAERRWLLVYDYKFSSTDWDVYGAAISFDGTLTQPSTPIDTSPASHRDPQVSSPTFEVTGPMMYGVTFADTGSAQALRGAVLDSSLQRLVPTTDLAARLNANHPAFARIESDGCRFVVTYADGLPAYVATLGVVHGQFVVHEAPQIVRGGVDAYGLAIASRGAATGAHTENTGYALVFSDHTVAPHRLVLALYEGHGAGGMSIRGTGCGGLGIAATGDPWLGRTVDVSLVGVNGHPAGMLLGAPGPAVVLCGTCVVGIDLTDAWINLPGRTQYDLVVPCLHQLVGRSITVQGYATGGPCTGGLRLGDSLDLRIQ